MLHPLREDRPPPLADDPGQEVGHQAAVQRAHRHAPPAQLQVLLAIGDLHHDRPGPAAGGLRRQVLAGGQQQARAPAGLARVLSVVPQPAPRRPVAGVLQQPDDLARAGPSPA